MGESSKSFRPQDPESPEYGGGHASVSFQQFDAECRGRWNRASAPNNPEAVQLAARSFVGELGDFTRTRYRERARTLALLDNPTGPAAGLEPATFRLQVGCATNCAKPAR